ncbi:hypothetical protein GALL_430720 [mine drainage metagenome]|uniref:Uncharacterized protein n=1 Tax=mine drainage metagenome TaxID=410659 RepID=A0A1J5QCP6_9ZZZZ
MPRTMVIKAATKVEASVTIESDQSPETKSVPMQMATVTAKREPLSK